MNLYGLQLAVDIEAASLDAAIERVYCQLSEMDLESVPTVMVRREGSEDFSKVVASRAENALRKARPRIVAYREATERCDTLDCNHELAWRGTPVCCLLPEQTADYLEHMMAMARTTRERGGGDLLDAMTHGPP